MEKFISQSVVIVTRGFECFDLVECLFTSLWFQAFIIDSNDFPRFIPIGVSWAPKLFIFIGLSLTWVLFVQILVALDALYCEISFMYY